MNELRGWSAGCACVYVTEMKTTQRVAPLTERQQKFADEYLICGNASASARKAGYVGNNVYLTGHRLTKNPKILAYLQAKAEKLSPEQKHTETLQSRVIKELSDMAFVNIADFVRVGPDGELVADFSNATPDQLKAITSLATKQSTRTGKDGSVEVERSARYGFADKYKGLELLGKHLGMFKESEQRVVIDVADRLLAARKRIAELPKDAGVYDDERQGGGGAGV